MPAQDSPVVAARRKRLKAWIDSRFRGVQAEFVKETGINQGELSLLLVSKPFGEKKAGALELAAKMPAGYLVNPLDAIPSSQPARFDDATMTQAVELLYLLADYRPDDKRFARITWPLIKVAAKAIQRAEGSPRESLAGILAELESEV